MVFLLRGRRFRPVLPEVLLLLPVQRQALPQRQPLGPGSGGQGRLGFTALDNGFAAVNDPAALQAICDGLGPAQIDALPRRWLAILPHPFTPGDRAAGYRYDISVLQAEFSLTRVLDKPATGRIFFDQVIHDNLAIGRPDQVGLVFGRRIMRRGPRATPGRFRTRVITDEVTPSLHVDYKNARIKQITSSVRQSEPKPPSMTPATSASGEG